MSSMENFKNGKIVIKTRSLYKDTFTRNGKYIDCKFLIKYFIYWEYEIKYEVKEILL